MCAKVITEKQDLTYLSWTKIRRSSGTAGSFLKAYSEFDGRKLYYKLSNYDNIHGIVGHECVNELIADRLLNILGFDHLDYRLIHADIYLDDNIQEVWLCESDDFKQAGEDKISLDIFYEMEKEYGESPLEFCLRMGWKEYIYQMLVIDYLILNRDRHGANIEVLRNKDRKTYRLAPLFDHGLSLICSVRNDEEAEHFDVMKDRPVQSFVGSRSARDNLDLIPVYDMPALVELTKAHREILFEGLEGVLPEAYKDKTWEMISKRWSSYEDIRHSK